MNDDPIGDALRSLPAEAADAEFTAAVLARLEAASTGGDRGGDRPRPVWLMWAGAATAAAALAMTALLLMRSPATSAPRSAAAGVRSPAAATTASLESPQPPALDAAPGAAGTAEAARLRHARTALADLRQRHARFASELRSLSALTGDGRPVLYLGGDEGLEVVLDLDRPDLGAPPEAGPRPAVDRRGPRMLPPQPQSP
jgi:hypothetical protein